MIITHELKMDLARRGGTPRIDVVQEDRYSRDLAISLYSNGKPWMPGEGVSVVVRYVKRDGTGGAYDMLPDGKPAGKISTNVVTAALAPQVCTAAGRVKLAVCLVKEDVRLHSFVIELDVQDNPGLQTTSEDYYKLSKTLPNTGWEAGKYLGTDEKGNVVAVDAPAYELPDIDALAPPGGARVGQYLRVLAVDESGKVTAVEAVDLDAGESAPEMYLYNGVELPALPEWDKAAYPYALIEYTADGSKATLYVSSKPLGFMDKGYPVGDILCAEEEAYYNVKWGYLRRSDENVTDFTFEYNSDETPWLSMSRERVLWANHNVMDWDTGTVLAAVSEPVPVPVYPETLTAGSITLLGADSKAYRIAVDGSGALVFGEADGELSPVGELPVWEGGSY